MILWERLVGAGCTDSINYNIRTIFLNFRERNYRNRINIKEKIPFFVKSGACDMIWRSSFFFQE